MPPYLAATRTLYNNVPLALGKTEYGLGEMNDLLLVNIQSSETGRLDLHFPPLAPICDNGSIRRNSHTADPHYTTLFARFKRYNQELTAVTP